MKVSASKGRKPCFSSHCSGSRHTLDKTSVRKRVLRIGLLMNDTWVRQSPLSIQLLVKLQKTIEDAGFTLFFSQASQVTLQHNVRRISHYISKNPADAWVVYAAQRNVLEWFSRQAWPSLAVAGRRSQVPIASVGRTKHRPLSKSRAT